MDSPAYLFDQYAKERGLSKEMAKRALMLAAMAEQGRSTKDAAAALRISCSTVKRVARKLIIDFSDYRPFAAAEKKGEDRPAPFTRDIAQPASSLPLFSAAPGSA